MQVRGADYLDLPPMSPLPDPLPFATPGVRKRSVSYPSLPTPFSSASRFSPCFRNAMDSARSVVPAPAPATPNRAPTMRAIMRPNAIQMPNPTKTLPYIPHTSWTGPSDLDNMIPFIYPFESKYPHPPIAMAYAQHHQAPHQHLHPLNHCRSSAPWMSASGVTC